MSSSSQVKKPTSEVIAKPSQGKNRPTPPPQFPRGTIILGG